MNKFHKIVLAALLVFSLTACTGAGESSQGSGSGSSVQSVTTSYNLDDGAILNFNNPPVTAPVDESNEEEENIIGCSDSSKLDPESTCYEG